MAKSLDSVLTISELATYLKISKSTLYKLAQNGQLPSQKVGRHWRFHREVSITASAATRYERSRKAQESLDQHTINPLG